MRALPARLLSAAAPLAALALAGCATVSVGRIPSQEGVYPASTAPDTPLVLAIPGLRVPALPVSQDQHFGHLVEMLAANGIPCRILSYDTAENPLTVGASLFASDLAIAWTRVGPAMVREVRYENERRAALKLPPLRRLVLFGYSQGGVLMEQIACRIFFLLKRDYDDMQASFGDEWRALQQDPEFIYFMNALDDFLVIRNIRLQRTREFVRDPELRQFYSRAEGKLQRQFNDFISYLDDPSSRYPDVDRFEDPETPRYPKRYRRVRTCAKSLEGCSIEEHERIRNFFVDYAQYHDLLSLSPSFISAAGSYFGSPRADDSFLLFTWLPFLKYFARRELTQIDQSRLGSIHHLENMENLVRANRDERYPLDPDNTLFLVGANGNRGDGFVDQSSAHLSDHTLEVVRIPAGKGGGAVSRDRLPDLTVVPLRVMHFPEREMGGWGRRRYGVAYMEEGNPGFEYLLKFIRNDWAGIRGALSHDDDSLRQFMLEIAFEGAGWGTPVILQTGHSRNVRVDGRYENPESGIFVWTGYFTDGQEMNLLGQETVMGTVTLDARLPGGTRVRASYPVHPGCNSFVKFVR